MKRKETANTLLQQIEQQEKKNLGLLPNKTWKKFLV